MNVKDVNLKGKNQGIMLWGDWCAESLVLHSPRYWMVGLSYQFVVADESNKINVQYYL